MANDLQIEPVASLYQDQSLLRTSVTIFTRSSSTGSRADALIEMRF